MLTILRASFKQDLLAILHMVVILVYHMCLLPGHTKLHSFQCEQRAQFLIESYPRTDTITNVSQVIEDNRKCYSISIMYLPYLFLTDNYGTEPVLSKNKVGVIFVGVVLVLSFFAVSQVL